MDNKSQYILIIFILIKTFFVQMCIYLYLCMQTIPSVINNFRTKSPPSPEPGIGGARLPAAQSNICSVSHQRDYLDQISRYYLFSYIFLMRCLRPVLKSSSTVSGRLRPRLHWAENWTRSQPRGVAAQHGFWEQRVDCSLSSPSFLEMSTIKHLALCHPDLTSLSPVSGAV